MTLLLDGEALASTCRRQIAAEARQHAALQGPNAPCLVTIVVGHDPASDAYVKRKHGDCEELGFRSQRIDLPEDVSQADLLATIASCNADRSCDGVIVQFPLPAHIDAFAVQEAIDPARDVDGLHPLNLGRMLLDQPGLLPCTPRAIVTLLQGYDIPLAGKRVAVIGRGMLVGRPLAAMLAGPAIDALPTLLHRGSGDLAAITREADVVVSAAGQVDLVTVDMIKPGASVVGVGISYVDGKMVSDIADEVAEVAGAVTPPRGTVGPMTRAMLMRNLLEAAVARRG